MSFLCPSFLPALVLPQLPRLVIPDVSQLINASACAGVSPLCNPAACHGVAGCHCPLALQALWCLLDVCRWPRTGSQGNCDTLITAVPFLVNKQHPKDKPSEEEGVLQHMLSYVEQARHIHRLFW